MAEYSKIAQGSFFATQVPYVVYLPFEPDYVYVYQCDGDLPAIASSVRNNMIWQNSFVQGGGVVYGWNSSVQYSPFPTYPNGIYTFSGGLSQQFGPQISITSISKANPAVVVTTANHNLADGDVVILSNTVGMPQIDGIPFGVTYIDAMTFSINWNTNQSNYAAVSSAGTMMQVMYPFLYEPGNYIISSIGNGLQTQVNTTIPNNLVVGQQVAFRIPIEWGIQQLNSLPNPTAPGKPIYGYVTSISNDYQFNVSINSSGFTGFNSNIPTSLGGLTYAQVTSVGDVNGGGWPYTASSVTGLGPLYPSPQVNGIPSVNGPAMQGAYINNTAQGFTVGKALITPGDVGTAHFAWEAKLHDYVVGSIGYITNA